MIIPVKAKRLIVFLKRLVYNSGGFRPLDRLS